MMKTIIRKSAPMLIALLPLFTACQSEPEVGSTLYPTEQEKYGPKVYINELAGGNEASVEVVQTPVSLVLPEEDAISFTVKLTVPVAQDVTVTVAADDEKAAAYKSDCDVLPASSYQLSKTQVTIPAGKLESTEPIKLQLVESDAIRNMERTAVVALSLSAASQGADVGKNLNTYYAVVNKKVTNFKGQSATEIEGKTQISYDAYTVEGSDGDDYTDYLKDGNYAWNSSYEGYYEFYLLATFTEPQPVSAVVFHASSYYPSYYTPKTVEVLTSMDGETWTSQTGGTYVNTIRPSSGSTPIPFVLYTPVTCKYLKFRVVDSFYWGVSYVSELKLYE